MKMIDLLQYAPLEFDAGGLGYRGAGVKDLRVQGLAEDVILGGVKSYLAKQVDAVAETMRERVSTPGAGQAMEYQEALAQAQLALQADAAGSAVVAANFPMLEASVGIDIDPKTKAAAVDVVGVARSVQAAYALWLAFGAAVRRARLAGKQAIDAAATIEAAAAAFDAIAWPAAD